jgi:CRP/FNR family transcriptional regulator
MHELRPTHDRPSEGPLVAAEVPPIPNAGRRRLQRGALLVMAGDDAHTVYFVRCGQLRVFRLAESGRAATTAVVGPGQIAGIAPLLGRSTYHAFVEALTPAEVWTVPSDRLFAALGDDPTLLGRVMVALARRLDLAVGLLYDVALRPVAARVAAVETRLRPLLGGEPARLTRQDLGALVGARRETVCRAVATREAA